MNTTPKADHSNTSTPKPTPSHGQTRPAVRMAGMAAPAAGITLGLFLTMSALIDTEFDPETIVETRTIERIVAEERNEEVKHRERVKPEKLAAADRPPPPPKLSVTKSDVNLPTPTIQGAAPTTVKFDRVQTLDINPVAISNRDATPIRPPIVTYPTRALESGTEGECSVFLNVDVRGRPYDVGADCTDSVFRREAIRAVSKVEFAPMIVKGQARERQNVVYPLVFKLN